MSDQLEVGPRLAESYSTLAEFSAKKASVRDARDYLANLSLFNRHGVGEFHHVVRPPSQFAQSDSSLWSLRLEAVLSGDVSRSLRIHPLSRGATDLNDTVFE